MSNYKTLKVQLAKIEQLMALIEEVTNDPSYNAAQGAINSLRGFKNAYQNQFNKLRVDLEVERQRFIKEGGKP